MVRSSVAPHSRSRRGTPTFARLRRMMLALLALAFVPCAPLQAEAIPCPNGPVVLVHGLEQGPEIFATLIDGLVRRGIERRCVRAIRYSSGNLPARLAAERELAPFVDQVIADVMRSLGNGQPAPQQVRINLVGHSMGALSTRWYATRMQPERVRTWISTSGANHGTNWQCAQSPAGGHGEMCPAFARSQSQSAVQHGLNGGPGVDVDETPYGLGQDSAGVVSLAPTAARSILYLSVQAAADRFIFPSASLSIDGAGGISLPGLERAGVREISPGNFQIAAASGHDELLETEALIEFVFRAVTSQSPTARTD